MGSCKTRRAAVLVVLVAGEARTSGPSLLLKLEWLIGGGTQASRSRLSTYWRHLGYLVVDRCNIDKGGSAGTVQLVNASNEKHERKRWLRSRKDIDKQHSSCRDSRIRIGIQLPTFGSSLVKTP